MLKLPVALAAILATNFCFAQTTREYYNEISGAGGLDQVAATFVCFNEQPDVKAFFVFTESKYLRQSMVSNGTFSKLSKAGQSELNKDFLIFRGYDKGVPLANRDIFTPNGSSWLSDKFMLDKNTPARVRFNISWETMRYKRSVEILNVNETIKGNVDAYGRCEPIGHTVRQMGK